jgi:1-acyl-sn-glycerol-3-phosphate acyltransferase
MPSWFPFYWYEATYFFTHWAMLLGFSLRTRGRNNIPRSGPVLVLANHQSFLDPVLVGLATRRHLRPLARKTLYRSRALAWIIDNLRAIPIDLEGLGMEGLKAVIEALGKGSAVLVFPEGTRTPDGLLHPLEGGIHLVLRRQPVPIVPVGIAGAYEAWPARRRLPRPAPLFLPANDRCIAISVGEPLDGRRFAAMRREQAVAELAEAMQTQITLAQQLRRRP